MQQPNVGEQYGGMEGAQPDFARRPRHFSPTAFQATLRRGGEHDYASKLSGSNRKIDESKQDLPVVLLELARACPLKRALIQFPALSAG
jgi:hypothetical protein